ncbi:uncharacterized protein N7482_004886 [Penicillium canariense]|uniref:Uncharacterized protein n=1 Tax=Penicillium canariense TaxID=189055 RepID=A0A9W9LMM5_9EURO|nr:uncharacterized protein N7482_004886 [Penicillium canariense]KAJ5166105.1 hypothetical protein N7482_004886 [Penicillium canariense]
MRSYLGEIPSLSPQPSCGPECRDLTGPERASRQRPGCFTMPGPLTPSGQARLRCWVSLFNLQPALRVLPRKKTSLELISPSPPPSPFARLRPINGDCLGSFGSAEAEGGILRETEGLLPPPPPFFRLSPFGLSRALGLPGMAEWLPPADSRKSRTPVRSTPTMIISPPRDLSTRAVPGQTRGHPEAPKKAAKSVLCSEKGAWSRWMWYPWLGICAPDETPATPSGRNSWDWGAGADAADADDADSGFYSSSLCPKLFFPT